MTISSSAVYLVGAFLILLLLFLFFKNSSDNSWRQNSLLYELIYSLSSFFRGLW